MVALRRIYERGGSVVSHEQFMKTFDGEVYRAHRYGMTVSLIVADVPGPSARAIEDFERFVETQLRRTDIGATLRTGVHALCLPHTDTRGANEVAERLKDALPKAIVAVVVRFPDDQSTPEDMLNAAVQWCFVRQRRKMARPSSDKGSVLTR